MGRQQLTSLSRPSVELDKMCHKIEGIALVLRNYLTTRLNKNGKIFGRKSKESLTSQQNKNYTY